MSPIVSSSFRRPFRSREKKSWSLLDSLNFSQNDFQIALSRSRSARTKPAKMCKQFLSARCWIQSRNRRAWKGFPRWSLEFGTSVSGMGMSNLCFLNWVCALLSSLPTAVWANRTKPPEADAACCPTSATIFLAVRTAAAHEASFADDTHAERTSVRSRWSMIIFWIWSTYEMWKTSSKDVECLYAMIGPPMVWPRVLSHFHSNLLRLELHCRCRMQNHGELCQQADLAHSQMNHDPTMFLVDQQKNERLNPTHVCYFFPCLLWASESMVSTTRVPHETKDCEANWVDGSTSMTISFFQASTCIIQDWR